MSETTVHKLLMAAVEGLTTSLPIAYPGKVYVPTGADYMRVTHLVNTPIRIGLHGSTPLDRLGIMQLDLFQKLDRHEVEYIAAAQDIADQFPRDMRLTEGDTTVVVVQSYVGRGRSDGEYWFTPVSVEYRA